MPTNSVVQILTASIAPVIVISGIGLLLLTISNRYGRAIDRARLLMRELESGDADTADIRHLEQQLRHTHHRARLLRASMIYGSVSIFFVTLTILSLFAGQLFRLRFELVALSSFALCLISLVISLSYCIRDITVSLKALEMEMSVAMDAAKGQGGEALRRHQPP